MMKTMLAAGLGIALAMPAMAATTGAQESGNGASPPAAAQKIYHRLEQAGFSDVHIMPHSYLVRAKDPDGNPVMMVINPDSVTAVTALRNQSGNSQGGQSGNGSTKE